MNMPLNTSANISDPIEQARYNMIEQQIRPWNVLDADVLELLAVVHREDFVPPACPVPRPCCWPPACGCAPSS